MRQISGFSRSAIFEERCFIMVATFHLHYWWCGNPIFFDFQICWTLLNVLSSVEYGLVVKWLWRVLIYWKFQTASIGLTENVKGDKKKFELWLRGRAEVYICQVRPWGLSLIWPSHWERRNQNRSLKCIAHCITELALFMSIVQDIML